MTYPSKRIELQSVVRKVERLFKKIELATVCPCMARKQQTSRDTDFVLVPFQAAGKQSV
jgi:hypothetical protein